MSRCFFLSISLRECFVDPWCPFFDVLVNIQRTLCATEDDDSWLPHMETINCHCNDVLLLLSVLHASSTMWFNRVEGYPSYFLLLPPTSHLLNDCFPSSVAAFHLSIRIVLPLALCDSYSRRSPLLVLMVCLSRIDIWPFNLWDFIWIFHGQIKNEENIMRRLLFTWCLQDIRTQRRTINELK